MCRTFSLGAMPLRWLYFRRRNVGSTRMTSATRRHAIYGLFLLVPSLSFAGSFDPLPTYNQSPLVQIFGLPAPDAPRLLVPGQSQTRITFEAANNFIHRQNGAESLVLDGETHRTALTVKYGAGDTEWGVEIPYISQSGGFLDSFISNWHDVFDLPRGGRNESPFDQLDYTYRRDGVDRLRITRASRGIGDIRLLAGWQLPFRNTTDVALRASLKLPTGNAAELHGSGAADIALWLSLGCSCSGTLGWNASAGALVLGHGDVLPDAQRRFVGFGGAGFGWRIVEPIVLKAELRAHSPFYGDTHLAPLGSTAVELVLGGTWRVDKRTALDLAVSEDARVETAPDVSLLISLRTNF